MSAATPRRETVEQLAEEFVERYRQGERPPLSEYTARYPEHAEQIRDLFPALVMMEQIAPGSECSAPPSAGTLRQRPGEHPEQIGDYRILREIGRGGMGIVYEAEQVSLGRHVALKVLPRQLLPGSKQQQRFEQEARSAARLHHTNIVPVFGVGEQGGLHYYAMQYIQGSGLDEVLDELRRLRRGKGSPRTESAAEEARAARRDGSAEGVARSLLSGAFERSGGGTGNQAPAGVAEVPSESAALSASSMILPGRSGDRRKSCGQTYWHSVAHLGAQVAGALAYAHQQGVLHRDIKPANLLLDMQGTVWVTDFGLAKAGDQERLTYTGDLLGTLRYMAPERFEGRTDARSEVYALGLTLYELLALRPAFDESDRHQLIRQVLGGEWVRLEKVNPAIPRDLVTIVHKAIDRDPACRYQTAKELADDLQCFLDDAPIKARRLWLAEHVLRWARHHKGLAAALAVIALLLVAVTLGSSLAAIRLQTLADEAERGARAERWERYRANIAAAASALRLQNASVARRALDEAPEEHRNWEWRHLYIQLDGAKTVLRNWIIAFSALDAMNNQLDGAQSVLRGHENAIWRVFFSSDGKTILSKSSDGTMRYWDRATGKELRRLRQPEGNEHGLVMQAFPQVLTRGDAGLRLLDLRTGEVCPLSLTLSKSVRSLAVSPDSRFIAFCSGQDKDCHLFDRTTGRTIDLRGHALPVLGVTFRPDGKLLATTSLDNTIRLWDAATGRAAGTLRGHKSGILMLAFSPDGRRIASGSCFDESVVRLWDVATCQEVVAPLAGHRNEILDVAFSPDGSRLVSASRDQTARLWDAASGKLLKELLGHTGDVNRAAFSPNGQRLATASADQTVRLWDGTSGELISVLRGHTGVVWGATFSPDGKLLASGSGDRTVRLWDAEQAERHGVLRGHTRFVYDVAFNPDGTQVASAAWDGTVRMWDATTGRETAQYKHAHDCVLGVAFSPDGKRLASVTRADKVYLWDVVAGKLIRELAVAAKDNYVQVRAAWDSKGTLVACGGTDGPVHLWDPATGDVEGMLRGHEGSVCDVAFSPDGEQLASGGMDRTVRLWDVATRRQVAVLAGHGESVQHVTYNPDGRLLASASFDGTVRLWDMRTHQQLAVLPHENSVHGAAFSPDGTRLATGCHDNTIRLWDVATGQQVAELRGHTDYVHTVAFSPDGTRLVSGSGDTTVRIWDTLPVQERARLARE